MRTRALKVTKPFLSFSVIHNNFSFKLSVQREGVPA
jgi:hypothetical protein